MPPKSDTEQSTLNVEAYLKRINFLPTPNVQPTLALLKELIRKHVCSIPFENIDVLRNQEISLNLDDLQKKIILQKRGGYCFELNTLFSSLLEHFGFQFKRCGARVIFEREATVIRPRTHKMLIVLLNGKEWLCDVSFGAMGLNFPIELNSEKEFSSGNYQLRIIKREGDELLQTHRHGKWVNLYLFNRNEMEMIDYEVANFYTSKYPDSVFRNALTSLIDRGTEQYIISNRIFTVTDGVEYTGTEIETTDQLRKIYQKYFGITLGEDQCSWFGRIE